MSSAKLAVLCGLAAVALSACGSTAKPEAGSAAVTAQLSGRGKIDDPRKTHLKCLQQHRIAAVRVGRTDIQIGPGATGPLVVFEPTPGEAQGAQIDGRVQGAEVIGAALLYTRNAPDQQLKTIETCLAVGVSG